MSHIAKRLEVNSKVRKDGRQLIFLRITKNRKMKRISTGVYINAKDFNKDALYGFWIGRGDPQWNGKNSILKSLFYKVESSQAYFDANRIAPTLNEIAKYLTNEEKDTDFFVFAHKHIEHSRETESPNTFRGKQQSLKKIKKFVKSENLDFRDITVDFLNKYEYYMKVNLGNSTNTIHRELKFIRTLFNAAIRIDLIGNEAYVFKKKRLKLAKVDKRKLTQNEIQKLIDLNLPIDSTLGKTLRYFLFSYYACGQRFSDTALLKRKEVVDDRLTYRMQKTKEIASNKLPQQAIKILHEFKYENLKADEHIFPIIKNDYANRFELQKRISSSNALINKNLKKLALMADIEPFSYHCSRHSFAVFAISKGIQIYELSKLLKHSSILVTENYIKSIDIEATNIAVKQIFG